MSTSESHNKKKSSTEHYNEPATKKAKLSEVVAEHYNKRGNTSCAERRNSKIFYMRNFNNWIKSVLIKKYLDKLRDDGMHQKPTVLDLGCGKGGDLLKWDKGHIKKLVCTDLASTSINQCQGRYGNLQKKSRKPIFDAEFIVSDSGKETLRDKLSNPDMKFDITSCQFVIHYTFESEAQAEKMVKNACECLRVGGYFIGTTVNDAAIMNSIRKAGDTKFGNDVFSVAFQTEEPFPDFGCKYIFKLHDVVDCPEFLLKKKSLVRICKKYGMRLVEWKGFADFFEENSEFKENFLLLKRMRALETFPPGDDLLNSHHHGDYDHARKECDRIARKYPGCNPSVATLSKTEWEAASIYVVYAFIKDEDYKSDEDASEESAAEKDEDNKIPLIIL